MDIEDEIGPDFEVDSLRNEFTGSSRESNKTPEPDEPICLVSYEVAFILLGDGPHARSSFWRSYRRELAFNQKTGYQNYHISVARHQLASLGMKLDRPVYFRNQRLTIEKQIDALTNKALTDPHFSHRTAAQ